jgi:hypothetical protein
VLADAPLRLLMTPDPLAAVDAWRRAAGAWLDVLGFGPIETPARVVRARPGAELLAYAEPRGGGPIVLLVPAPIKRAYIWDLVPAAGVVRRCLERRLRPYVVRWTAPGLAGRGFGLADYADRLLEEAMTAIEAETGGRRARLRPRRRRGGGQRDPLSRRHGRVVAARRRARRSARPPATLAADPRLGG